MLQLLQGQPLHDLQALPSEPQWRRGDWYPIESHRGEERRYHGTGALVFIEEEIPGRVVPLAPVFEVHGAYSIEGVLGHRFHGNLSMRQNCQAVLAGRRALQTNVRRRIGEDADIEETGIAEAGLILESQRVRPREPRPKTGF